MIMGRMVLLLLPSLNVAACAVQCSAKAAARVYCDRHARISINAAHRIDGAAGAHQLRSAALPRTHTYAPISA